MPTPEPDNDPSSADRLLRVETIYHEPAVVEYERGREVLESFPDAKRIEVASHWNIPELHGDASRVGDWNKTKRTTLVLGVKKNVACRPFYRSCDFVAPSQANGCAMACSYCYVARRKGYANPITTFVNIEEILGSVERHAYEQGMKFEPTQADPDLWVYEFGTNSDGFFDIETLPKKVAIVGAGYIAVEFAGMLNALGSETHLFIRHKTFLRAFDPIRGLAATLGARVVGPCAADDEVDDRTGDVDAGRLLDPLQAGRGIHLHHQRAMIGSEDVSLVVEGEAETNWRVGIPSESRIVTGVDEGVPNEATEGLEMEMEIVTVTSPLYVVLCRRVIGMSKVNWRGGKVIDEGEGDWIFPFGSRYVIPTVTESVVR